MKNLLLTERAVLVKLQPVLGRRLILLRSVISPLALGAGKNDINPHVYSPDQMYIQPIHPPPD